MLVRLSRVGNRVREHHLVDANTVLLNEKNAQFTWRYSPLLPDKLPRRLADPQPLDSRKHRVARVLPLLRDVEMPVELFEKASFERAPPLRAAHLVARRVCFDDGKRLLVLHTLGANIKLDLPFVGEHRVNSRWEEQNPRASRLETTTNGTKGILLDQFLKIAFFPEKHTFYRIIPRLIETNELLWNRNETFLKKE